MLACLGWQAEVKSHSCKLATVKIVQIVPKGVPSDSCWMFLPPRRGDPNAEGQDAFCPSSAGWPPFMRVNPVLDWGYGDVWALLRAARLPYCALYDRGFTSIGSVTNTRPNRRAPPRARARARGARLFS